MYKTQIKLKDEVYFQIRNDIQLREKISEQLGITDISVYRYGVRKSPTLSKPVIIKVISEHTGKSESEIIETLEYEQEGKNTRN